uniref:PLCXc domain-containing protein n=1 Tax=Steinernema glaseri TaxID=37863 RepID=A0A1I8AUA7_9BILA
MCRRYTAWLAQKLAVGPGTHLWLHKKGIAKPVSSRVSCPLRASFPPMYDSAVGRSSEYGSEPTVFLSARSELTEERDVPRAMSSCNEVLPEARVETDSTAGSSADFDGSNWMLALPCELRNAPLNTLSIPGSHNSGTYFLDARMPISADKSPLFQLFASALPRRRIHSWATCQNLSVYRQLELGVRYLDLRVARTGGGDPFRVVHGLWGPTLHGLLYEVKLFLDDHPYEVVLLDLNHLYRVDAASFDELLHLAVDILGERRVYRNTKDRLPGDMSLQWMAANGFRVVLFAEHNFGGADCVLQKRTVKQGNSRISEKIPGEDTPERGAPPRPIPRDAGHPDAEAEDVRAGRLRKPGEASGNALHRRGRPVASEEPSSPGRLQHRHGRLRREEAVLRRSSRAKPQERRSEVQINSILCSVSVFGSALV